MKLALQVSILLVFLFNVNARNDILQRKYADLFNPIEISPESRSSGITKFCDAVQEQIKRIVKNCPMDAVFSTLSRRHMSAVMCLEKLLTHESADLDKMLVMAKDLRQLVNPKVWIAAMERMSLYNSELRSIQRPSSTEAMPDEFFPSKVLQEAENIKIGRVAKSCAISDEDSNNGADVHENKLWYFREDLMANSHHWNYHIAYPLEDTIRSRPDRRGELFYYLHHAMLSRYRTERISNGLPDVKSLEIEKNGLVAESYTVTLKDDTAGKPWTSREANTRLIDVTYDVSDDDPSVPYGTERLNLTIEDLVTWHKNIIVGIEQGYLVAANGTHIPLNNFQGIDWLAEIVENTAFLEVNPELYGNAVFGFHNSLHVHIGLVKDPLRIHDLPPGVLSQAAVAIRDPVFYRIHSTIEDLFVLHKSKLPSYELNRGDFPLIWNGITVKNIETKSLSGIPNELKTFWATKNINLPHRGVDHLDGGKPGPFHICLKHLDHDQFSIKIDIERAASVKSNKATIRVFLAPRHDFKGTRISIQDEFNLFFPIFVTQQVHLKEGSNAIELNEEESDITIPWPQALSQTEQDYENATAQPFCGCGWPQHLLLPKGTPEGQSFDLLVMVTDGNEDKVIEEEDNSWNKGRGCRPAFATCGIPGRKYPDNKPMGYPFDRKPSKDALAIEDWVARIPNMKLTQIKIKSSN